MIWICSLPLTVTYHPNGGTEPQSHLHDAVGFVPRHHSRSRAQEEMISLPPHSFLIKQLFAPALWGNLAILTKKPSRQFRCSYHVGTRLVDLENTVKALKSLVPYIQIFKKRHYHYKKYNKSPTNLIGCLSLCSKLHLEVNIFVWGLSLVCFQILFLMQIFVYKYGSEMQDSCVCLWFIVLLIVIMPIFENLYIGYERFESFYSIFQVH